MDSPQRQISKRHTSKSLPTVSCARQDLLLESHSQPTMPAIGLRHIQNSTKACSRGISNLVSGGVNNWSLLLVVSALP